MRLNRQTKILALFLFTISLGPTPMVAAQGNEFRFNNISKAQKALIENFLHAVRQHDVKKMRDLFDSRSLDCGPDQEAIMNNEIRDHLEQIPPSAKFEFNPGPYNSDPAWILSPIYKFNVKFAGSLRISYERKDGHFISRSIGLIEDRHGWKFGLMCLSPEGLKIENLKTQQEKDRALKEFLNKSKHNPT